ncbi:MAG: NAD(P)-dependent alcohol dehydrogenase [Pseudomonadota bacterium]
MSGHSPERRAALAQLAGLAAVTAVGAAEAPRAKSQPAKSRSAPVRIRAYEIGAQQGTDSLVMRERDAPVPGYGEVLIKVHAAALNHGDIELSAGPFGPKKPPTRIPLADGAGEVLALGEGVARVKVGDRVTAASFTQWEQGDYFRGALDVTLGNGVDGWLAEQVLMPAHALVRIPDDMSYLDAAAWPVSGTTSWSVLHTFAGLKAGDIVLALGTGGIATATLQLARASGARVAVTSSSDAKLATMKRLGADITVNYRTTPQWEKAILEATGGHGADIVVESVGLATLPQSIAATAVNGRIGLLTIGAPPAGNLGLGGLLTRNAVMKGITVGSRHTLEEMLRAAAVNRIKPVIDRVFTFAQAVDAFRYLGTGEHVGKVVVSLES